MRSGGVVCATAIITLLSGCFRLGFHADPDVTTDGSFVDAPGTMDGGADAPADAADTSDSAHHDAPLDQPGGDGPALDAKLIDAAIQPPDTKLPDKAVPPLDKAVPPPDKAVPPDKALPDQGPPCLTFEICDGKNNDCDGQTDEDCVAPWWNTSYPHRVRLVLTNSQASAYGAEPLFIPASKLGGGATPIKESSLRVVKWTKSTTTQTEVPFALHDWTAAGDDLGDSDGNVDSNDELLLLVDLPASGTTEYYVYYDVKDHAPKVHPTEGVTPGGSGFSRVSVDGSTADRAYLRFSDGAALFDLMLTDSIPFWNHTSTYQYESSAIGPRINDLTLPGGTAVSPTVNHTTGQGTGELVHTIRLGPLRLNGNFSIFGNSHAFYQPRLVSSISHSAVRARSRPIAAVVVIDAEFYCDEPTKCAPARDYGDVRLIGYLFDRGAQDEVLMRWRIEAKMDGSHTINATTKSSDTEFFNMAAYMIESYNETQYASLIDIDTTRVRDKAGAVVSTKYDNTGSDKRSCKETDSWILMSDTEAPYKGVAALVVEGQPKNNGAAKSWRGCWFVDGNSGIELNGFQSEWHINTTDFSSWGNGSSDTSVYSYWIYAYPATASDQALANTRATRVKYPPAVVSSTRPCSDFPGC
jgi:hypothetical protein